jgi:antitoxin (DNA-binding transcriptional repressor) of toxin-antitoxin stability system
MPPTGTGIVTHNVKKIGHLDTPGGGQVVVRGKPAYIGHIDPPYGTSIVDVSDLSRPRLLSLLEVPSETHSHKVRVSGDIMVINNENYTRHQQIGGSRIPAERARLTKELGRPPTDAELSDALKKLSNHLGLVREGQEVLVTSHRHRVARILPAAAPDAQVTEPSRPVKDLKKIKGIKPRHLVSAAKRLLEDRRRR